MAPTPPPADINAEAYALFFRARSAITAARYPRRLDYTISVSGIEAGASHTNHYKATCDPLSGSVRVLPISDEELASPPPHPHDFDFRSIVISGPAGPILAVPVGRPPDPDLLGGVPILEPTYSFGLSLRHTSWQSNQGDADAALPVIAVVSTNARDYDISLVDMPTIDGTTTYHLRLTPRHKPKDFRLRELWIGMVDYLPRQILLTGNFTVAPLVDVPWLVSFNVADGVPYIAHERARETLYLAHRHVVTDAEIAFDNVREPSGAVIGEPLIAPDANEGTLVEP
ncbi:MAG TPA: hypothetical protein VGF18_00570 [Candidatus Tumulicola sp.]|jgi:hypothetical protein